MGSGRIMGKVMGMAIMPVFLCILIYSPESINGDVDPAVVNALLDLSNSLTSKGPLTNWNGGDPCKGQWFGVICSGGSSVTELKLSNQGLVGSMGYQLANLKSLVTLDLSNNQLGNSIPYSLPSGLVEMNLAGNNLTGSLPYLINNLTSLEYLNVSHNQLQDQVPDIFQNLSALSSLDFSFNSFTGNLPQTFSRLPKLSTMYLQNNKFTGTIDVLANISALENLNVEHNKFIGWIPEELKQINLKTDGNSWNSAPAPPPPPGTPPAKHKPKSGGSDENSGGGIGGGGIAAIVISILVVGAIVAFFLVKRRSKSSSDIEKLDNQHFAPMASSNTQETKFNQLSSAVNTKTYETSASLNLRPPPFERPKSFDEEEFTKKPIVVKKANTMPIDAVSYSVADLQMATGSFSMENLIGEGSLGRVYRAQFDDGKVLAVKKVDSSALSNHLSEEFMEIVASISRLHNPNITELVGYCSEHGQHLLVYEFHKNGSLYDFLHLSDEYSKPLAWNSRVKIALGTARALEYLHEVCSPSVVHKNIKSANILLDMELNPHLSDCGLASFIPNAEHTLNNAAASGYSAPEVAMSGQYTLKSDVYSFGVAMLELLTGRKPFDSSRPRSEQLLVSWATPQLHDIDALAKMVDPALEGLYPVKSLSRFADVIALCVQSEPEFRPPMSEVVEALVRLVQRANMSKRTVGNDKRTFDRGDSFDQSMS